jgi:hypothetical protein
MLSQPFLTDLDTRAQVKGSVDPLGAMAIWARLGRRVVGNLSTVTTSVRDFKTLVLGFGLISDLRRKGGPDNDLDPLAAFLRSEQLAAYTRASSGDWGFRGLRRVRSRMAEGQVVPVSAERDCQILGNQKIYGLWGLFTVPSADPYRPMTHGGAAHANVATLLRHSSASIQTAGSMCLQANIVTSTRRRPRRIGRLRH